LADRWFVGGARGVASLGVQGCVSRMGIRLGTIDRANPVGV